MADQYIGPFARAEMSGHTAAPRLADRQPVAGNVAVWKTYSDFGTVDAVTPIGDGPGPKQVERGLVEIV
jgi:hypothetical protein